MNRIPTALLLALLLAGSAYAGGHGHHWYQDYDRGARWFNANIPWHAPYAHATWRHPVALIVPPTANMQTNYSWGVARTRMTPIYHQFARPFVPPGAGGVASPAPNWPSDTNQVGVYYIRGPW
jgi:hypothetical protein